ncbi:MAG: hypothetical protein QG663_1552, partial [Thermodesulfobacteriota bacterium]|nr:hypothetical protein [Thermodesulfobacteriota bacterium]
MPEGMTDPDALAFERILAASGPA